MKHEVSQTFTTRCRKDSIKAVSLLCCATLLGPFFKKKKKSIFHSNVILYLSLSSAPAPVIPISLSIIFINKTASLQGEIIGFEKLQVSLPSQEGLWSILNLKTWGLLWGEIREGERIQLIAVWLIPSPPPSLNLPLLSVLSATVLLSFRLSFN